MQCTHDPIDVGIASEAFAFIGVLTQCSMTAFVIASATRSYFVLEPTRTAFDPWHEMFSCWANKTIVKCPATPHTGRTITFDDHDHPFPAVGLTGCMLHLTRMVSWRAVLHLLPPVICISAICGRRWLRP